MKISPFLLNILNLIFIFIVTPIIIYFLFTILKYVLIDLKTYEDIYQYKIKSFFFNYISVFIYFCFFILLMIGLRILYVNNTLDLKEVVSIINSYVKLQVIIRIYILIIIVTILLFIIRIFLIIDSFFMKELLKLHIYLYTLNENTLYYKLYSFFNGMANENDILCYYIRRWIFWINYIWFNSLIKKLQTSFFIIFHSKIYKILFNFSPLWVIIYDCYYHNFVLSTIYPYLLFYVPISIIRKISKKTLMMEYLVILVHEIYYKNNRQPNSIYLMHTDYYPLLEEYVRTQFAFNPLLKTMNQTQLGYEFDLCYDIYSQSNFILYDPTDNRYINNYEVKVKKVNGEYFQLIYDEDKRDLILSDVKWILL